MGRIVAIAGGDLKTTHRINQYIVALTKKEKEYLSDHQSRVVAFFIQVSHASLGAGFGSAKATSSKPNPCGLRFAMVGAYVPCG